MVDPTISVVLGLSAGTGVRTRTVGVGTEGY